MYCIKWGKLEILTFQFLSTVVVLILNWLYRDNDVKKLFTKGKNWEVCHREMRIPFNWQTEIPAVYADAWRKINSEIETSITTVVVTFYPLSIDTFLL